MKGGLVRFLIRWAILLVGGMVGHFVASVYLIRGENEGDDKGFVDADPTTLWGKDDAVRVLSILAGAKLAARVGSRFMGGGK